MVTQWNLRCAAVIAGICLTSIVAEAQPRVQVQVGPTVVQARPWGRPTHRKYQYGARAYAAELSTLMVQQANAACLELHDHYRHNRGFQQTYALVYKLLEDSQHIDRLVKQNYHRQSGRKEDHIARDLLNMDALFDQVEDQVAHYTARRGNRRHDEQLRLILDDFELTLDYLMVDYGVKSTIERRRRAIVAPEGTAVVVPPGRVVGPPGRVVGPPGRVVTPPNRVIVPQVNVIVPRRDR